VPYIAESDVKMNIPEQWEVKV